MTVSHDQSPQSHPLDIYGNTKHITWIFHWFIAAILLSLTLGIILSISTNNTFAATFIAAGILPILTTLFLVRYKKFEWASIFLSIVLLSLITILATNGLGIHQLSNLAFPAIIIITSLFTRKRTMVFLTLYTMGCIAWLVFGEISGAYSPGILVKSVPGDFLSASLAILVTAFMARLLTESLFQGNLQLQTELKERKLAEAKYRNIFDNAIIGIFQSTPEGGLVSVNPAMARMYGYDSPQDMLNSVTDIANQIYIDPNSRAVIRNRLEAGEEIREYEALEYRKDRSTLWTSMNAQVVRDETGRTLYYEGTVEDITFRKTIEVERRRAEEALLQFRNVMDESNDAIYLINPQTSRYIDFNRSAYEKLGYSREEIIQIGVIDVAEHITSMDIWKERVALVREKGGLIFEANYRRKDGTKFPTEVSARMLDYGGEKIMVANVRDITIRKHVEAEREQLILKLAAKNAESETLRDSFATIVGTFEFSEIIQHILDQIKRVIPYDSASVWKWEGDLQKFISGRNLPPMFQDENVEFFTDETNAALPILMGDVPYILNNNVQKEMADFNQEPHTYINSWLAFPLKVHGKIIGLIALDGKKKDQFNEHHAGLVVTFANQVAIALENSRLFTELQSELFTREKLIKELESKNTELERFTYTISHDLKSPLVTINGFLGYLKGDMVSGKSDRVMIDIQRIQDAVDKMHLLLKELLELSRIGRIINPPEEVPFYDLVQDALEIVHGQLEARGVTVQIQPNLPTVHGDRQRLIEVLQNLIDNATKYIGDQPAPRIEIGQHSAEDAQLIFFVRDNGVGINSQYHERIFGLFNKLDAGTEGTGVGLALAKRIIEVHGGRIWVESEGSGKGSTFLFTLPRGDA